MTGINQDIELTEHIFLTAYRYADFCRMYRDPDKDTEDFKYTIAKGLKSFQEEDVKELTRIADSFHSSFKVMFPEIIMTEILRLGFQGFTPETSYPPQWNVEQIEEIFKSYASIAILLNLILREKRKHEDEIRVLKSDIAGINNQLKTAHTVVKRAKLKKDINISVEDLKVLIDSCRFPTSGTVNLTKLGKKLGYGKDTAKKIIINSDLSRYANLQ